MADHYIYIIPKKTIPFLGTFVSALLISALCFGAPIHENSPLFDQLRASPSTTFSDLSGDTYSLSSTDSSLITLKIVEQVVNWIFQTPTGSKICREVFFRQNLLEHADLLSQHFGVSNSAAHSLAKDCRSKNTTYDSPFLYSAHQGTIQKFNLFAGTISNEKKTYTFLVTQRTPWPYDSWTDASNRTFIVVEDKNHFPGGSQLNWSHLIKVISHELAVYLDSLQLAGGPGWHILSPLSELIIPRRINLNQVYLALNNPLIQQTLTSWRGFLFEYAISRELVSLGLAEPHILSEYSSPELSFLLDKSCETSCLLLHLTEQSRALSPSSLFLSAIRPEYRLQKLELLNRSHYSEFEKIQFNKVLSTYPDRLLQMYSPAPLTQLDDSQLSQRAMDPFVYSDFFYFLIDPANSFTLPLGTYLTANFYENYLLPEDLRIIGKASRASRSSMSLIERLKLPYMGSINIEKTLGPRPRIRTGGLTGRGQK